MTKKRQQLLFALPPWVPVDAWIGYLDMRAKIRKPMTEYAVRLAIDKLWKFKEQGYDPKSILEQSILNSWQGLFPVRDEYGEDVVVSGKKVGRGYIPIV